LNTDWLNTENDFASAEHLFNLMRETSMLTVAPQDAHTRIVLVLRRKTQREELQPGAPQVQEGALCQMA
jgi:hypothetical protein